MPRSAIATGLVDAILPVARMPEALEGRRRSAISTGRGNQTWPSTGGQEVLGQIIALLRTRADRDFTLYKTGTLTRRIERRMALAEIPASDMAGYLERLKNDKDELDRLADDLLITCHEFLPGPDPSSNIWRGASFRISCAGSRRAVGCVSGFPDAAPARRPIRW